MKNLFSKKHTRTNYLSATPSNYIPIYKRTGLSPIKVSKTTANVRVNEVLSPKKIMMNMMIDQVHLAYVPKPFSAEQSDRMTKGSRWKLPGTKLSRNLLDKNYKIFNS